MEFPEELLINILVRLPLKDILRFKLVCKLWFTLITSGPYFTSNYVRNSPFTIILCAQGDDYNKLSLCLLEFAGKGGGEYTNIPITQKIQDSNSRLSFIGSYDCSVFMLQRKRIANNDHQVMDRVYLFNPVLGSCVKVTEDIIEKRELWKYKVGFIPSNNTYKLVRFIYGWGIDKNPEIFTVGLDENWRIVDDPLFIYAPYCFEHETIGFNGAFHWVTANKEDTIFTFHLLEEKCGVGIPKPHEMSQQLSSKTRVTILKDRLSMSDLSEEYTTMVIWTMREYGVVESWSKFIVLTLCDDQYPEKGRHYFLVPIAVLANGDILFDDMNSKGTRLYNLEEKQLKQINEPPDPDSSSRLHRRYKNTYVPTFDSYIIRRG